MLLYAELATRKNYFTLDDVLLFALKKQQDRRPNFSGKFFSAEEVHKYWRTQKIKASNSNSLLSDIPGNMPALLHSKKIQDRVADVGFDWEGVDQVISKLDEEINEFKMECNNQNKLAMLDELGDIFFTLVNIARHLDIDAEQALRYANKKFIRRFQGVEEKLRELGQRFDSVNFLELLEVWEQVKLEENLNKTLK